MEATHRVKDSNNKTVGFVINNNFFTDYFVRHNIESIDNLSITKNGVIRSKREIPLISYKDIVKSRYDKIVKYNPFIRDIQEELTSWKNNISHQVIQIEGARQIGKTTEILKFAYSNYEYIIYVNLAEDTFDFLNTVTNQGSHILAMENYCRKANLPHYIDNKHTVVIIDEIQVNPKVYNSIRTINSNLNCDLIVTGSYLGRVLGDKRFFLAAGTVQTLIMFPLSFKEFCKIFKADKILETIDMYGKSKDNEYEKLDKAYEVYRKIGGYPSVIKKFIETGNINECMKIIAQLLDIFKNESKYYFRDDKEVLIFNEVYTEAIRQMVSEKKGSGSKLIEQVTELVKSSQKCIVSRDEVSRAIRWIIYSGIIGEYGLYIDGDTQKYSSARRIYYMDCGITNYIAKEASINASNLDGILTETFVYGELYRLYHSDYLKKRVYGDCPCFSTYGSYELDFMLVGVDNIVYGIEVKTTTGEPKSLKVYIDKGLVDKGVVAKRTKGGHGDKFDTIPIYTVGARFPYK